SRGQSSTRATRSYMAWAAHRTRCSTCVSISGTQEVQDDVESSRLEVAEHVAQACGDRGPLAQAAQSEIEERGCLHEDLDDLRQAFFGGERVLAQAAVIQVVAECPFGKVGAAQGA